MKNQFVFGLLSLAAVTSAYAQSLYDVGADADESMPLKWVLGVSAIYDDNVAPGVGNEDEDSMAINPYVGVSFIQNTPQTTIDLYARLGLIYYFDAPEFMDEVNSQSRVGLNITHRVSERLRFSSNNFVSYELEPDYSYGYASSRATDEYLFWQSDNSVGFRWTERFGTYTGIAVGGLEYNGVNNDWTWVQPYNQFRYQISPQTVLTAEYRYRWNTVSGVGDDNQEQFLLVGAEHRFNLTTVGVIRGGAQIRDSDAGDSNTSPYLEASLQSQMNEQFSVKAFARYGYENYDSILPSLSNPNWFDQYDERSTFRLGVAADYSISKQLSIFGGVDYIPTSYEGGRPVQGGGLNRPVGSFDESIFNAYLGFTVRFTDHISGNVSYNYTQSTSDLDIREYDRNRISVGVSAEF